MPPEILREVNDRNKRMWEEFHLELNSKQMMLMCFKYHRIYNYQRQATSILDIRALDYYSDKYMDAWLRTATMEMSAKSTTRNTVRTTCVSFATRFTIS